MRPDIAKKLVERPRFGGGGKAKLIAERRKGKNPDKWEELPQKESCKKVNIPYYNGKYLNEYFAPLKGFLRKSVGRPWDKVNSEVRALLSPKSPTQNHVLDHLYRDFVELTPVWIDGEPCDHRFGSGGTHRPLGGGDLYVDQHGILRAVKIRRSKPRPKPEVRKVINDLEEYRRINDSWFWVKYKHLYPGEKGFDVILGKEYTTNEWGCAALEHSNGECLRGGERIHPWPKQVRLAVEKRQVSKRTIRTEGLNLL